MHHVIYLISLSLLITSMFLLDLSLGNIGQWGILPVITDEQMFKNVCVFL